MSKANTKICPYCSGEININAIKCKHCKKFLPDSNKENIVKDKKNIGYINIKIYILCAIICFISLILMLPTTELSEENTPQIKREKELKIFKEETQKNRKQIIKQRKKEENSTQKILKNNEKETQNKQITQEIGELFDYLKAPKCDNRKVQNIVKQIFKEHNPYYLNNSESVTDIFLKYPVATSYDSSIEKYFCKGTVIVNSSNSNNPYQCDIKYTAQRTSDGFYVESSCCEHDILYYSDF